MDNIKRIYVEKKLNFNIKANHLMKDIKQNLKIEGLSGLRIINCYDVSGITEDTFKKAKETIFSETNQDMIYQNLDIKEHQKIFGIEYLPGQYDQRADSAQQCIKILNPKSNPIVKNTRIIILEGQINDKEFSKIKDYIINPVDSREISLKKLNKIDMKYEKPEEVEILNGLINKNTDQLIKFKKEKGLAMNIKDLKFIQKYFRDEEKRNPTITEIRVLDTYWSDHCRHTTFMTKIDDIKIEEGYYKDILEEALQEYLNSRDFVYKDNNKDICLMDLATISMKEMKKRGLLEDLDISDEINASSIVINIEVDGKEEEWLIMFKNETHNHPTEIEPYGGAATCLGGAIRDPLSGRSYVYQAMRVTGSGNPNTPIEKTLEGKLPQIKITTEAAEGYSSYGNQIGIATGQVSEIYDEGFIAKRMEIGAVIGAAPKKNVIRKKPQKGDVVLLVGGRTGRDGCGGATGSSKAHTEDSILTCGAEVQKGNPPEERKIQRFFRNPIVSRLIKKCNDFGAGGVSVAVGELSPSIEINLDNIPKKYEGLDGTELAISESQERMAVVIDKEDLKKFVEFAKEENLEATKIADITDNGRLIMKWRNKKIVDIERRFLDTNGIKGSTKVKIQNPQKYNEYFINRTTNDNKINKWLDVLKDINVADQKGLGEIFDSTIGARSVVMPYGGKYQLTASEGMVSKIPTIKGDTNTCTIMTYGYDPKIAKWSPFHGGIYSVLHSIAKIVAMGGDIKRTRLTLQEYFERLDNDYNKWGKPFSALLGANLVQKQLQIPAIGGKDSMSGTFEDINVPPTLVSFAVSVAKTENIISREFKKVGSNVIKISIPKDSRNIPDFEKAKKIYKRIHQLAIDNYILSSSTIGNGGIAEAVTKMSLGNMIGINLKNDIDFFSQDYGSLILEIDKEINLESLFMDIEYKRIGQNIKEPIIKIDEEVITLKHALKVLREPLKNVFPIKSEEKVLSENKSYIKKKKMKSNIVIAKPRVFIPIFPGTNCEYDMAKAFERSGGVVESTVFNNMSAKEIENSIKKMKEKIDNSQIIALPGGFSAGDEPDGSGKFIASVFRNPFIKDSIMNLLRNKDGLILGICNGFQALIKLGLVPYGEITNIEENSPTLTFNKSGKHISTIATTKIVSNMSPWFNEVSVGDVHKIPMSHGEGRLVINKKILKNMTNKGQIATEYINNNPNGSVNAIEGITSPDGRILGKMGHSERIGKNLYKNVEGQYDQKLFESGIKYFK